MQTLHALAPQSGRAREQWGKTNCSTRPAQKRTQSLRDADCYLPPRHKGVTPPLLPQPPPKPTAAPAFEAGLAGSVLGSMLALCVGLNPIAVGAVLGVLAFAAVRLGSHLMQYGVRNRS